MDWGIAEAMCLGKPVIATAWSGNMDFMRYNNSCPVNFKLVELQQDHGPYKSYQKWADADCSEASKYMLKLFEDTQYYQEITLNAKKTIEQEFSPKRVSEMIERRLNYIAK